MDQDNKDFLSDKKESIGLVIYQIAQLDKSVTQLTERLDIMTARIEQRISTLELWRAGFNQKTATLEQLNALRSDYMGLKSFLVVVLSLVVVTIVGAVLKLILKI